MNRFKYLLLIGIIAVLFGVVSYTYAYPSWFGSCACEQSFVPYAWMLDCEAIGYGWYADTEEWNWVRLCRGTGYETDIGCDILPYDYPIVNHYFYKDPDNCGNTAEAEANWWIENPIQASPYPDSSPCDMT